MYSVPTGLLGLIPLFSQKYMYPPILWPFQPSHTEYNLYDILYGSERHILYLLRLEKYSTTFEILTYTIKVHKKTNIYTIKVIKWMIFLTPI